MEALSIEASGTAGLAVGVKHLAGQLAGLLDDATRTGGELVQGLFETLEGAFSTGQGFVIDSVSQQ